jgi:hypothetical protein
VCQLAEAIHPKVTESRSLRNTDPRLAGRGHIRTPAAVTVAGACPSGQPIVFFIAIEKICPVSTIDLIGTTTASNDIITILTKGPIIVRATLDGVVARATAQYIITAKTSDCVYPT